MPSPPPASPQQIPETWTATAPGYAEMAEQTSVPFAVEALRLVALRASDRVLDVATGPGPLALLAARVAARVVAVDFSEGMVAQVREGAARAKVTVEAQVMDAQALAFDDGTFDAAFCLFGFMFFPDRAKAFREMHRVLTPGGRALVATWAPIERRPLMKIGFDAMAEAGLAAPGKGDLQSNDDCIREMTAGGFRDVEVHAFTSSIFVPSPEEYLKTIEKGGAPLVLLRKKLGPEAWAQAEARLLAALRTRIPASGATLSAEALLTVGHR